MNPKKLLLFTIVSLVFLINVSIAQQPLKPHIFYGDLYLSNGNPAPSGLTLVAKINDTEYGSTKTSDGKYDYLIVTDPENQNEGKTIHFYVNGIEATPTHEYENGGFTELDLTLTSPLPVTTTTTTPTVGPTRGPGPAPAEETTTTVVEEITTTTTTISIIPKTEIDIVDLIIPSDIYVNESFELGVKVKNIGDEEGSDSITIDLPVGWTVDKGRISVHLSPGESTTIYFRVTPTEKSGKIAVGSSTDFEISGEITPRVREKVEEKPFPITGWVVNFVQSVDWFITVVAIAVLLFLFFVMKELTRGIRGVEEKASR